MALRAVPPKAEARAAEARAAESKADEEVAATAARETDLKELEAKYREYGDNHGGWAWNAKQDELQLLNHSTIRKLLQFVYKCTSTSTSRRQ